MLFRKYRDQAVYAEGVLFHSLGESGLMTYWGENSSKKLAEKSWATFDPTKSFFHAANDF
jgi:hypothetical protein